LSNEKFKSENYQNLGGINTKMSPMMNTPLEFLDLVNFDFQTPGALTQRWGSTMYVGQTFSGTIKTLFEFNKLDGSSYVIIGHTGGLWSGATTGNSQGLSMTYFGATQTAKNFSAVQYRAASAAYVDLYASGGALFNPWFENDSSKVIDYKSSSNFSGIIISTQTQIDNNLSSVAMNNWVFMADGNKFIKYNGTSTYAVGLPAPILYDTAQNISNATNGSLLGFAYTGAFGVYASYVNNRGFESKIWPVGTVIAGTTQSASLITFDYPFFTPQQYGISSINIYSYYNPGITAMGGSLWNAPYRYLQNVPLISGSTSVNWLNVGSSLGGQSFMVSNNGAIPPTNLNYPIGFTTVSQPTEYLQSFNITPLHPRYLEAHQDRLFCSGFSANLSTVVFSDVGEPEGYPPENSFEVRTNDGDYITGMKAYKTALYVFKQKSFHGFFGDNASNFYLQETSLLYGAVNNRCIVRYQNLLAFLDRKGVIGFNGASTDELSIRVQPLFDRMNYAAAMTHACMVHDTIRNQLLVAFPIDGASLNNTVLAYDYKANAWSQQAGYVPTVFAEIQGRNQQKTAYYGSYSGMVSWFGSSFTADNGTGFTLTAKTRFLNDMGESTQKQFRRLYVNMDAAAATQVFKVNAYQDYGTSIVLATTLVNGSFQNRVDFGISAKAVSFEIINMSSSSPLKIHGYTVESRRQRKT
jgi:hypothetical protein